VTIAAVRSALAGAVETISGIRAIDYIPDQVNPPQAVVFRNTIDYDLVYGRGADEYHFTVRVYVGRTSERKAQEFLDELCEPSGATSLKTVVEANATLAALVDYARVRTAGVLQVATVADVDYLACDFDVEIVY
jgi:hypothetical protein